MPGASMSAPMRGAPSPPERLPGPAWEPAPARSPNSSISPSVGVASPQTIFMTVDFPAPFFPTNP